MFSFVLDGIRKLTGQETEKISSYLCVGGKLEWLGFDLFKKLFIYLGVCLFSCGMQDVSLLLM